MNQRFSPDVSVLATGAEQPVAQHPFPIAGIGASAGGLEAFVELLQHLAPNTGMAFVLGQHLDPNHESQLGHILAQKTQMPVHEIMDGTIIEPNHIYIIPPRCNLDIEEGRLRLSPRADKAAPHLVDHFFTSLANAQQSLAIGVILSGTGADGTLGMEEIKAAGGITFAEDRRSAKFDEMPLHAANSCVDFILPPKKIAEELARIGQNPCLFLSLKNEGEGEGKQSNQAADFRRILSILRAQTGIDLSQYRDATIKRRIQRRMVITTQQRLADYIQLLEKDSGEAKALFEDVLINVTSFFREPDMFEVLKQQVFPEILKKAPPTIRIWIPACSTGQEAYSMAIALLEFLEDKPSPPAIQIFATDVNESIAVEKARRGFYPDSIESEISPERLSRFFTKESKGYRISKAIREACIFAQQNITADPPFSRVHLISCRNVLIYFTPALQRRVISTFHYALSPGSYLVLGNSETVGANSDLFEPVDQKHKIFIKKETASRSYAHMSMDDLKPVSPAPLRVKSTQTPGTADFRREAERILLNRYAPPAILVNSQLEVLQFHGRTSLYLEPPPGEPSFNLLKMAKENLPLEIGSAVQEVKRQNGPVRRLAHLREDHGIRKIELEITPVRLPGSVENCYLVLFEEPGGEETVIPRKTRRPQRPPLPKTPAEETSEINQLRSDLAEAREYLKAIIEQHDAANEEIKCVNEEVVSSNEKLQSANEQLSTAKEELQSTNEELITLNDELQMRNGELKRLNSDLHESHEKLLEYVNAIVDTVRAPVLVLQADFQIHRANEAFHKTFDLAHAETEGHMIFELSAGQWNIPGLRRFLSEVLTNQGGLKDFEAICEFPRIGRRVMRLNARRLQQKSTWPTMLLLSIEDITVFRQIEEANRWLAAIVESSSDAIIGEDFEGKIISCNDGACQLYGYSTAELIGKSITLVIPPELQDEEPKTLGRIRRGEKIQHYETIRRRKDGSRLDVSLTISPIRDVHGDIIGASNIARNITERKHAEAALRESEGRFRIVADSAPVLIWLHGPDKLCLWVNKPWLDFTGRTMELETGAGWTENVHPDDLPHCLTTYNTAFTARQEFKMEYRRRRHDGEYRWVLDNGIPRYLGREFAGYIGSCVDVTDRKTAEEKLEKSFAREKEARESAEAANRAKDGFLAALSHELRTPLSPVLLLASEASKNPDLPREVRRDFDTIRKNVELEARLIDDLLDLTRITFGKLSLELNLEDGHEILHDALVSVRPDLDHKRIELVLDLHAPHPIIRCDPVRLQQVFWNVLKNAVKFTPEKGRITIKTSVRAADDKFIVSVTDTGIGLLPEEIERIFSAFAQGSNAYHFGGLGLGLAISRKLVEFHAGQIYARSEGRDCGAVFVIELPLAQGIAENYVPVERSAARHSSSYGDPNQKKPRVLLVEDHEPTRGALVHLLSRRHYDVVASALISEALELAAKEKFDFIISDIGLPDGNGNDLMAELGNRYGLKGIALTGYGMEHDIARSRSSGFLVHLTKPVHVQSLEAALATPGLWTRTPEKE